MAGWAAHLVEAGMGLGSHGKKLQSGSLCPKGRHLVDPGQCPVEAGELSAPRRAQRLGPTQRLPVSLQRPCDPAFHYAMSHPHTRLFLRQVPCAPQTGALQEGRRCRTLRHIPKGCQGKVTPPARTTPLEWGSKAARAGQTHSTGQSEELCWGEESRAVMCLAPGRSTLGPSVPRVLSLEEEKPVGAGHTRPPAASSLGV